MVINYNRLVTHSTSEGPGVRFVIWMQGCIFNCKGCSNQEMLPLIGKNIIDVEEMCAMIDRAKKEFKIEGISVFGGEPFLQPQPLKFIAKHCQATSLSVLVFTGFIYETLLSKHKGVLDLIDILVDGPFLIEKFDKKRNLIGSTNQRVFYLSDRYNVEDFPKSTMTTDVEINDNGWTINGAENL